MKSERKALTAHAALAVSMQWMQPSPRPSPFSGREREKTSVRAARSLIGEQVTPLKSSPSLRSERGEGRGEESFHATPSPSTGW